MGKDRRGIKLWIRSEVEITEEYIQEQIDIFYLKGGIIKDCVGEIIPAHIHTVETHHHGFQYDAELFAYGFQVLDDPEQPDFDESGDKILPEDNLKITHVGWTEISQRNPQGTLKKNEYFKDEPPYPDPGKRRVR